MINTIKYQINIENMKTISRNSKMHDEEVNKRAREVEKELQEMKEQWIKIYELLTNLIDDTTIDNEYDE